MVECPTAEPKHLPLLSVVVPVYKEAGTIIALLDRLSGERTSKEIVIVNDGSTDGSGRLVDSWISNKRILNQQTSRIVQVSRAYNRGKGRAVRSGLELAQGEFFLVQDAEHSASDL